MKKLLSILLILALVMTSFVACGKDEKEALTAREMYDKVQEKTKEQTNMSFLADFDLDMSGLEEMGFAGPMGLTLSGDVQDPETMMMNMNLDTGQGMTIQADLYYKDEVLLVNAPLLQSFLGFAYVQMDINELTETAGVESTSFTSMDQEQILGILDRFEEETEYSIYDLITFDENMEEKTIVVNEEEVDVTTLKMSMTLEGADAMFLELIKFVLNDEEAKALFLAETTAEDIVALEESIQSGELEADMNEALEMITINQFEMIMNIDENYNNIKTEINADLKIADEIQTMTVKFNGFIDVFNIGNVQDIEMPEVDPAEIFNLSDMF